MPIYEYQCPSCGHEFENIHKVSAPAPPCPTCGGGVEKKISLAAFHLKGSGWYADAYAGKDNKKPGGADKPVGDKPTVAADSSPKVDTASKPESKAAPAAKKAAAPAAKSTGTTS